MKWWFKQPISNQIFIAIIIGVIAGLIFGPKIAVVKPIGDIFVSLILMMVILLIVPALITGMYGIRDTAKIGRVGIKIVVFFITTTIFAGAMAIVLANVLGPGRGLSMSPPEGFVYTKPAQTIVDVLINIVPRNAVQAFATGNLLSILFVVVFFGMAMIILSKTTKMDTLAHFFEEWSKVSLLMLSHIIKLAPYGAAALIAYSIGVYGAKVIGPLGFFVVVVYLGEILILIEYTILMLLFKIAPAKFYKIVRDPAMIAFTTCSSMASLGVNVQATEKMGVPRGIATFGVTLGNVIHMDGTALYQAIAVIFISQVYGLPLTIYQQIMVVVMATLVTISLVGVPGAGTATLGILLMAVGLPVEGIGLVLAVDRICDMPRTMNNVIGDALVTLIAAKTEGMVPSNTDKIQTKESNAV